MTKKQKLYIALAVGLCCSLMGLYFIDPTKYVWVPKCPTKLLFGISCPGCGFQRALHAMLHGHFGEAVRYNFFLVLAVPYLIAIIVCGIMREGQSQQRLKEFVDSKWMTNGYIIIFLIWFVVRNIYKI